MSTIPQSPLFPLNNHTNGTDLVDFPLSAHILPYVKENGYYFGDINLLDHTRIAFNAVVVGHFPSNDSPEGFYYFDFFNIHGVYTPSRPNSTACDQTSDKYTIPYTGIIYINDFHAPGLFPTGTPYIPSVGSLLQLKVRINDIMPPSHSCTSSTTPTIYQILNFTIHPSTSSYFGYYPITSAQYRNTNEALSQYARIFLTAEIPHSDMTQIYPISQLDERISTTSSELPHETSFFAAIFPSTTSAITIDDISSRDIAVYKQLSLDFDIDLYSKYPPMSLLTVNQMKSIGNENAVSMFKQTQPVSSTQAPDTSYNVRTTIDEDFCNVVIHGIVVEMGYCSPYGLSFSVKVNWYKINDGSDCLIVYDYAHLFYDIYTASALANTNNQNTFVNNSQHISTSQSCCALSFASIQSSSQDGLFSHLRHPLPSQPVKIGSYIEAVINVNTSGILAMGFAAHFHNAERLSTPSSIMASNNTYYTLFRQQNASAKLAHKMNYITSLILPTVAPTHSSSLKQFLRQCTSWKTQESSSALDFLPRLFSPTLHNQQPTLLCSIHTYRYLLSNSTLGKLHLPSTIFTHQLTHCVIGRVVNRFSHGNGIWDVYVNDTTAYHLFEKVISMESFIGDDSAIFVGDFILIIGTHYIKLFDFNFQQTKLIMNHATNETDFYASLHCYEEHINTQLSNPPTSLSSSTGPFLSCLLQHHFNSAALMYESLCKPNFNQENDVHNTYSELSPYCVIATDCLDKLIQNTATPLAQSEPHQFIYDHPLFDRSIRLSTSQAPQDLPLRRTQSQIPLLSYCRSTHTINYAGLYRDVSPNLFSIDVCVQQFDTFPVYSPKQTIYGRMPKGANLTLLHLTEKPVEGGQLISTNQSFKHVSSVLHVFSDHIHKPPNDAIVTAYFVLDVDCATNNIIFILSSWKFQSYRADLCHQHVQMYKNDISLLAQQNNSPPPTSPNIEPDNDPLLGTKCIVVDLDVGNVVNNIISAHTPNIQTDDTVIISLPQPSSHDYDADDKHSSDSLRLTTHTRIISQ